MIRKSVVILVGMICLFVIGFTNVALAKDFDDNPIDKAFAGDINAAMSSYEMNYVSEKYMEAWKAEMGNVAAVLKKQYIFAEDKARIDAYTAAYERVAVAAGYVEWLNWSNKDEDPKHRSFGTGAPSASLSAKARIYKQATLNLIDTYQGHLGNNADNIAKYNYLYSGKGAELAKVK